MYGKEANFINHFITVYPANLQSKKNRKNIVHPFFCRFFPIRYTILVWYYYVWQLFWMGVKSIGDRSATVEAIIIIIIISTTTHEYTNGNSTLRVVTIYNPQLTSHILKMCSSQHLVERKTHIFDKIKRFTFCPSNQICIQCETCPTYKHIHTHTQWLRYEKRHQKS